LLSYHGAEPAPLWRGHEGPVALHPRPITPIDEPIGR
jgi:hypothetical protein